MLLEINLFANDRKYFLIYMLPSHSFPFSVFVQFIVDKLYIIFAVH